MKHFLMLLLLSSLLASLQIKAEDDLSETKFNHTILSKMIKTLGGSRLTDEMAMILSEKPHGVIGLQQAFDKANTYSMIICDVVKDKRHSRDEVDAVRHFIGSSLLSAYFDKDFARRLLTAHEKRQIGFNDENYMDLNNNELGYAFGETIPLIEKTRRIKNANRRGTRRVKYLKVDDSIEFFKTEIERRLAKGELYVLETGKSACANPGLFPNM